MRCFTKKMNWRRLLMKIYATCIITIRKKRCVYSAYKAELVLYGGIAVNMVDIFLRLFRTMVYDPCILDTFRITRSEKGMKIGKL